MSQLEEALRTLNVNPFDALAKHFEEAGKVREERNRYHAALVRIAVYDDLPASGRLTAHGSYSSFDEPNSVRIAREALADKERA